MENKNKFVKKTFIKGTSEVVNPNTIFNIKIGNWESGNLKVNRAFIDYLIEEDLLEVREVEIKSDKKSVENSTKMDRIKELLSLLAEDTDIDIMMLYGK